MTKKEERREAAKLQRARVAMSKLTAAQQAMLLREFGRCACADISKLVKASPAAGLGAIIGGVVGALLGPPMKLEAEKPKTVIGESLASRLLGPSRRGV